MAGVITTGNNPKLLWPGLAGLFGTTYNDVKMASDTIFDQRTSTKLYEEIQELAGFGLASVKTEAGGVTYTSSTQGPTTRATNVVYGLGFIETQESVDDNQYEEKATDKTIALARSMKHTRETVLMNVLNRAFSDSYLGGDGIRLVKSSHTTVNGTQSNTLTADADLSEASIEDMLINIMNATDSTGLHIGLMAKRLIIAPNEAFNAQRILKSTGQNDTANNAINAVKSMGLLQGDPIVSPFLTDADAWFIQTDAMKGLTVFNRRAAKLEKDGDFDTGNYKHKATERYVPTWGDWRNIFGSAGA
ncbi:MAG: hypothetical protein JWM16_6344 [Verrucomicrobiales bacterium]|nr:hypothetical protein [Verrucomicrobiales bacterium]